MRGRDRRGAVGGGGARDPPARSFLKGKSPPQPEPLPPPGGGAGGGQPGPLRAAPRPPRPVPPAYWRKRWPPPAATGRVASDEATLKPKAPWRSRSARPDRVDRPTRRVHRMAVGRGDRRARS